MRCAIYYYRVKFKVVILGLRSLRNRSLLCVNEDFEGKHNAEVHFKFSSIRMGFPMGECILAVLRTRCSRQKGCSRARRGRHQGVGGL